MSDYKAWLQFRVAWLWWWAKDMMRDLWRQIPGPVWVKVIVMAVFVIALAFPGQADEIVIIGLIKFARWAIDKRNARRARATLAQTWDESSERLIPC
jgi:hypothetical protein